MSIEFREQEVPIFARIEFLLKIFCEIHIERITVIECKASRMTVYTGKIPRDCDNIYLKFYARMYI